MCASKRAGHTSSLLQCFIDPNGQAPPLTHGMSAGITASVATVHRATFKGFCFMESFFFLQTLLLQMMTSVDGGKNATLETNYRTESDKEGPHK